MKRYVLVGADPTMVSSHHGGVITLSRGLIDHVRERGDQIDVVNTLRPSFDDMPLAARLKGGLSRIRRLDALLRSGACSGVIIVSGTGWSLRERLTMAALCRMRRVRSLLIIVDGWFLDLAQAGRLRRKTVGFGLRLPHRIASTGKRWNDVFSRMDVPGDRVLGIHYWLSDLVAVGSREKTEAPSGPLHFLFVGWMVKEKGVEEMLSAIEQLWPKHDFRFTFVGGGTLLESVRERIRRAGWEDRVSAPGWVSNEQLQTILRSADVFVLPSYAEGFPMALIEAFWNGLPAIVTDVGGVSESLHHGENGFLIPPRSVGPLVQAMERYLLEPQLIPLHSRAAIRVASENHKAVENCELILAALR